MLTVMVDIRSCDSWWQRNGEAVYFTHEPASLATFFGNFHYVSPEKAGVPSLATIFSTSYKPSSQRLRSKTFQSARRSRSTPVAKNRPKGS